MLDYLGLKPEAAAVEAAVQEAVVTGQGTREIGGSLGTRETGDYIASRIRRTQGQPRNDET
jgi:isocitrate/isopropylmalate dehydrogenase